MCAFGMEKQPLSASMVGDLISGADGSEILAFTNCSRILVDSCVEQSTLAWTPQTTLPPLVCASNIRDVVYHNPLLHSNLKRLKWWFQEQMVDPHLLGVNMLRDEARLLEAAAPLYYGGKQDQLLSLSQQSLESIHQGLPLDHPLRCQAGLDLWFFKARHSKEINKIELADGISENFGILSSLLFDSDPNLLARLSARTLVLGERLGIDELRWIGESYLGRLRQENPWLPNLVFDERYKAAKDGFRLVLFAAAMPFARCSEDFWLKRGKLFRDLTYYHVPAQLVQTV